MSSSSTGFLSGSAISIRLSLLFLALGLLTYWSSSSRLQPALGDNLSARPPEVTLWYHMLAQPSTSTGPFRLWVTMHGTVSHLNCALYRGICPLPSTNPLRPFFSPESELGALLSSHLEVALYKFP